MRLVHVVVSICVLFGSMSLAAQPTAKQPLPTVQAQRILAQGREGAIEALVNVGKVSPSAAAAVIVEVVKSAPRLLEELIRGLSVVLTEEQLQQALTIAANTLKSSPLLAKLLDDTISVFGCSSVEGCARRVNDVPRNIEDGTGDTPASPS